MLFPSRRSVFRKSLLTKLRTIHLRWKHGLQIGDFEEIRIIHFAWLGQSLDDRRETAAYPEFAVVISGGLRVRRNLLNTIESRRLKG